MKVVTFLFVLVTATHFSLSQPLNNECLNAEPLVFTTNGNGNQETTVASLLSEATYSGLVSSCEANTEYVDVFYEFTMPVDGNVRVSGLFVFDLITLYEVPINPGNCNTYTQITCRINTGQLYNLQAGTTYIVQHAIREASAVNKNITIELLPAQTNDERETALPISFSPVLEFPSDPNSTIETYTGTSLLRNATPSSVSASCDATGIEYVDLWYEFTMPFEGTIKTGGLFVFDTMSIYTACDTSNCDTSIELSCINDDGTFYELEANTTYLLRHGIRANNAITTTFTLQAFPLEINDDCDDSLPITVSTTQANTYTVDFRGASESEPPLITACENATTQDIRDVFWEFVMPVTGTISITAATNTEFFTVLDACEGNVIDCDSGNAVLGTLTGNTTYILRYSERDIFANSSSFSIQAYPSAPNDTCDNAQTITVPTGTTIEYTTDFRGATEDDVNFVTNCETVATHRYPDVWWEFTMPIDGNLLIKEASNTESFTLYEQSSSANECIAIELDCGFGDEIFYNLTQNTTYFLRHAERDIFVNDVSTFEIEAIASVVNDDCANVSPILVATTDSFTYSVSMEGGTEDDPNFVNTCDSNASHEIIDVWWEFEMPVDGSILIDNVVGSSQSFTLFDSCGGLELGCNFGQSFFYELEAGQSYTIRQAQRDIFAQDVSFDIQAFASGLNDACADAIFANVGVVSPLVTTLDFKTFSPSSGPSASCENTTHTYHDAFYEVVMPFDGALEITSSSSSIIYGLYEDDCNGAEISCFFGASSFFNLEGGNTYLLSVARRDVLSNIDSLNFSLQAISSPLAPCQDTTEFVVGGVWSNGLPDSTLNAVIRSNYDSAAIDTATGAPYGSIVACSVSIDTGTTLTIASDDFIDVSFGITVNGTLNVAHQGSVVQRDPTAVTTKNGTIEVEITTPFLKPRDFMIMGSPMTGETRADVWGDSFGVFEHTTANFSPNAAVTASFPNAENFADEEGDDFTPFTGVITPGEGYLVRPQLSYTDGNTTYSQTHSLGTLVNGDVTYAVGFNTDKISSFNLLANPYPSAILADDFINANAMVDEVYFWEHINTPSEEFPGWDAVNFSMEDISMYNLMGGVAATSDLTGVDTQPNGMIATAQGFGIKASAGGMATFTNEMRRTTGNTTLRTTVEEKNRLWLAVENETYGFKNTMLVGFTDQAGPGYDPGYDSKRIPTTVSVFSYLEGQETELAIQSRETFEVSTTIPVGFSTQIDELSTYTISIEKLEGQALETVAIYLFDTLTNKTVQLNNKTYEFTATRGEFAKRFVLLFEEGALSTQEQLLSSMQLFPNPTNSVFYISNPAQIPIKTIEIFDVMGRSVYLENKLTTSDAVIDISSLQMGNYLVQISSKNATTIKRLIKK